MYVYVRNGHRVARLQWEERVNSTRPLRPPPTATTELFEKKPQRSESFYNARPSDT